MRPLQKMEENNQKEQENKTPSKMARLAWPKAKYGVIIAIIIIVVVNLIYYKEFENVDIRIGTVIEAYEYNELKKPSIILKIDFGEKFGIKKTSAQLQKYYKSDELINKQVIAVVNFEPKQIGKIISEVLVLGVPDLENEPVLLSPDKPVNNGGKLF